MKNLRQVVGTARLGLLILACLIFESRVRAQFGTLVCGVGEPAATDQAGDGERAQDCGYDGADWIMKYRTPQHWTPTSITPMKTIAVNLVICRDANGLNGWEDTPVLRDELDALFDSINYRYSHSQVKGYTMTCEPTINHIVDTKIRFRLNELYFVDNTAFNLAYDEGWGAAVGAQDVLDWLWATYPDTRNQLNHILTMPAWDDGVSYAGYSPSSPYQGHTYVHSINQMLDDWPFYINHYCHEYAHLIGLHHVYDGEYKQLNHYDFLDDVFGQCHEPLTSDVNNPCFANCRQPDQPCACTQIAGQVCYLNTCNFFQFFPDPKPLMGNSPKIRYISPKSAGRMHRALSIYNYTFRLNNRPTHQYVDEKYSYAVPYTVSTNETWDFGMKLYQDLVITAGTTLTLTCELRMPIGGKIIVHQGGKLIVDGGVITCAHTGQFWQGIEAWGTTNQHQFPVNNPTYQGMVVLKNGAVIEHARWGFINWKPDDWNSLGGVIQVQGTLNSVGGTFRNCWRGAEFMAYHNFYPSNHAETNDNSYFRHAEFIVDDDYRGNDDFDSHLRMWMVKGISIQQCDFINAQSSSGSNVKPSHTLGMGIYSYDASYSVTGQCAVMLPPCEYGSGLPEPVCPEASLRPSRFIGLDHGIRAGSSGIGGYTYTVKDSYFENNVCASTRMP